MIHKLMKQLDSKKSLRKANQVQLKKVPNTIALEDAWFLAEKRKVC